MKEKPVPFAHPAHFVPYPRKIAWGLGGLTVDMVNVLWVLAMPVFSVGLGVKAALIGVALAVPRVWDAISDPLMGHISDNTRSRWGRRRPYIFVGAIGLGISFALLWMPSPEWSETVVLAWFIGMSLLFFTFLTIWQIPWTALGLELTPDVRERNGVQAVRSWFATGAAFIIPAILPLAFYFGKGDEVAGVRTLGWMVGGIMALCAILAAIFCEEKVQAERLPKISFWKSARYTLKDRRFLGLCAYAALFTGGILLVSQMGYYINVFFVYGSLPLQEAKEAASNVMFWGGISGAVSNLAAVPLIAWLANRLGKKPTLLLGVLVVAFGQLIKWFFFIPESPYLQVWLSLIIYPGIIVTWTLIPSMIADICDFDELETGQRREGMYSATFAWLLKVGVTIAMALSGWLINVAGIVDSAETQTPEAIRNMRILFTVLPTIFVVLGGLFVLRYPIREEDAEAVKETLAKRHNLDKKSFQ
jgi:glycoside/pentoside/hexuronide:cation symporter, GPH family